MADEDYQRRVLRRLRIRPERQVAAPPALRPAPARALSAHPRRSGALRELPRGAPVARAARLQRPHRARGRAAAEASGRGRADPRPVGCRAGGRVPGSQPGAVRGDHRTLRRPSPLLRRRRRRAVHLLLGRRRSADPPALSRRFRRHRDRSRQEPPLLPPDLRGRPPRHRAQPGPVREEAGGRPRVRALRGVLRLSRRGGGDQLAARGSVARPRGHRARLGRVRAALSSARDRPVPGDPVHRGGHSLPAGPGTVGARRRADRLRRVLTPRDPRPGGSGRGRGLRRAGAAASVDRAGAGPLPRPRSGVGAARVRARGPCPRRRGRPQGLAFHLPRGEPRGARPHARHPAGAGGRAALPADRAAIGIRWRSARAS